MPCGRHTHHSWMAIGFFLTVVEASPFQICFICGGYRTLAQKIWYDYPWSRPKGFLSRQALGLLWLPKIQHAGLTHRFQVSVANLSEFVCLFAFVFTISRLYSLLVLLSICLQLISRPICGMRLLQLPDGMAHVRCYSHASFERGNSCIPWVSTWCVMPVLLKHHVACLRLMHLRGCICCSSLLIAAPVWAIFFFCAVLFAR